MKKNDNCWCGSKKAWKRCHYPFKKEDDIKEIYKRDYGITIKTEDEVKKIKEACRVTSEILQELVDSAKEGITPLELDKLSLELHKKKNAIPACLGYGDPPFPATICTSLNEVVCHGIPDERPFKMGDIVNIDLCSIVDGYIGDVSKMVVIGGKTTKERQLVVDVAKSCLDKSIKILKPALQMREIANVIEEEARLYNCSVVYSFVGHGVGLKMHEPPEVHHNYNNNKIKCMPNMIFTIEPMINFGLPDTVCNDERGWVNKTVDNKPSAQWEHTILITENGYEVLTF